MEEESCVVVLSLPWLAAEIIFVAIARLIPIGRWSVAAHGVCREACPWLSKRYFCPMQTCSVAHCRVLLYRVLASWSASWQCSNRGMVCRHDPESHHNAFGVVKKVPLTLVVPRKVGSLVVPV